jgi:probable rRNA maturation factor
MIEINNTTKFKIGRKGLIAAAEKFFNSRKLKNKDLSVAFISDNEIKKLNLAYRKKNKITDILSFGNTPSFPRERGRQGGARGGFIERGDFFGEIVISPAQIKRQARELGHSFEKELLFIFVHGLFHLVGYGDETEKDRLKMIKLGEDFIKKL